MTRPVQPPDRPSPSPAVGAYGVAEAIGTEFSAPLGLGVGSASGGVRRLAGRRRGAGAVIVRLAAVSAGAADIGDRSSEPRSDCGGKKGGLHGLASGSASDECNAEGVHRFTGTSG